MDEELVIQIFEELKKPEGENLCNKRRIDAALVLSNGEMYGGTNGSIYDSCARKGHDFCRRDYGVGALEYVTCPSPCAEGSAILNAIGPAHSLSAESIIAALFDEKVLEGSTLISTYFPCNRCRSIIIDAGINELYFGKYKEGKPRLKDAFHAAQMISSGVKIYRILERLNERRSMEPAIKEIDPGPDLKSFTAGKLRTSGEAYIRMLFDKKYRAYMKEVADIFEKQVKPLINIDKDCLIFKPRL